MARVDDAQAFGWEDELLDVFGEFSMTRARKLTTSIRPDDYEYAYRILYKNSSMFDDVENSAVVIIAEHLFRHSQAGLPEITLCACLVSLSELLSG